MPDRKDLWGYMTFIFSLPNFPNVELEKIANLIGSANIKSLISRVKNRITEADLGLTRIQKTIKEIKKEEPTSILKIKEVSTRKTEEQLRKEHLLQSLELLEELISFCDSPKFVLPQFRGVKHFKIGDEVMVFVKGLKDHRKIVKYDWISAKILHPGWDWIMHCHSNEPWTRGGDAGGHYLKITNQYQIFKRDDFFGLRKMIKENPDVEFLQILPKEVVKNVCSKNIEPLTDNELKEKQPLFIKRMSKVVDFYPENVPLIAKRYKEKI